MELFERLAGHEQVAIGNDPASGLRCIVAIHSTVLGPALGGTRFYPYGSDQAALDDVLRLSRGMTYKAACAGLDLGGGKAVILGTPATDKTEALLRAYGRVVGSLGGRYVTACDIGTSPEDMAVVRQETTWVTGATEVAGGAGDSGVMTAYGTYVGLKACVQRVFGTSDVGGLHVALQGAGKVGRRLAAQLHADGAKLTVADVDRAAAETCAERWQADIVAPADVHRVDADVFSPNALGGVLNARTIPELQCRIVVGAANNQLGEDRDADLLADRGILYAPDYVVNAGGIIQVSDELHPDGYDAERVAARTAAIGPRVHAVLDMAAAEGVTPARAADLMAERRIGAAAGRSAPARGAR